METTQSCPYCGEEVSLWIDVHAGASQRYVEDCPVCCRPWEVVVIETEPGEFEVSLARDAD